ncbi:MAG: hypothetical protein ABIY51_00605 [Ferruginibacter sp.]
MKSFILLLIISLSTSTFMMAQQQRQPLNPGQREQKIEALYVAYMTRELNLTEDEAQKFWPIHAQFDKEVRDVKMEASELDRQQQVLNIKKKYQDRFTKVLGPGRTNDFFVRDGEFRKKLIERLKKMRQNNGGAFMRKNNMPPSSLQNN